MQAFRFAFLMAVVLAAGCTQAGPANTAAPSSQASAPGPEKVLTISISMEPNFISTQSPVDPRGATDHYLRMFNAQLDLHDEQAKGRPYL
ncbi:MAG TPA: hypothetical protein VGK54_03115, partial [Chloroflexota bacterium]